MSEDLKSVPGTNGPHGEAAREKSSSRSAAGFVVRFAVVTFVLFAAVRFAIGTPLMGWYLFQVARHTVWTLDRVGEARFAEPGASGASAWDAWSQRNAALRQQIRQERDRLEGIERHAAPQPGAEDARRRVEAGLTRLEQSATFPSQENAASPISVPGLSAFLRDACGQIDRNDPGLDLDRLAGEVETWRIRQAAFLRQRLDSLTARQSTQGPLVRFEKVILLSDARCRAFTFSVVPDCGALPVVSLFVAAVFAFPVSLRQRAIGILAGVSILHIVNVLRLACLASIGACAGGGEWFDFAHKHVWQGVYLVFVVALWIGWAEFVVRGRRRWRSEAP